MLDKIFNLSTPEGRAVYRFFNVVVPQGAVAFLLETIDRVQSLPVDNTEQAAMSFTVAALITAYMKYLRDTKREG